MISIKVSSNLKLNCPNTKLGCIQAQVQYEKEWPELWSEIDRLVNQKRYDLQLDQIVRLPIIKATRKAYRALGKEPSRYRCSAEALLRRILRGKSLYHINNLVDIINYISISFHYSIGCYDLGKLVPPIIFDVGQIGESYRAIGRGLMNIESLPIFRDQLGPFGSPTSDSERSMISGHTKEILIVIISFNEPAFLRAALNQTVTCLKNYARTDNFEVKIIS